MRLFGLRRFIAVFAVFSHPAGTPFDPRFRKRKKAARVGSTRAAVDGWQTPLRFLAYIAARRRRQA